MPASLKSATHGRTMLLTVSNPESRNALSPGMYAAGVEAFNAAERNDEVRSVVIAGEGGTFCSGIGLQQLKHNREQPPAVQAQGIEGLHQWIETIRTFPKPVIAAVEGAAAGAGFSLALACDLIVAADDARFAMYYSNVALSSDGGASWHLSRSLPRQLASELLLLGQRIGARRLHELGIVNRVAASGNALPEALALADALNQRAPNALASLKELLNDAAAMPLVQALAAEREHFVKNLHHPNAGAGIDAFLEKRAPHYR